MRRLSPEVFVVDTLLAREGQSYSDKDLEYVLHIDLPCEIRQPPLSNGDCRPNRPTPNKTGC